MKEPTGSTWKEGSSAIKWWSILGMHCEITLEPRPHYCDRGNYIAKIFSKHPSLEDLQDAWPRYYMDFDRAKLEIEDWMKKRKEWVG